MELTSTGIPLGADPNRIGEIEVPLGGPPRTSTPSCRQRCWPLGAAVHAVDRPLATAHFRALVCQSRQRSRKVGRQGWRHTLVEALLVQRVLTNATPYERTCRLTVHAVVADRTVVALFGHLVRRSRALGLLLHLASGTVVGVLNMLR